MEVPAAAFKELRTGGESESSAVVRERVVRARRLQAQRGFINARLPSQVLRRQCVLDDAGERTLETAVRKLGLSARAHDRILKVARTLADLADSERLQAKQVAEAGQSRSLDRNYWS